MAAASAALIEFPVMPPIALATDRGGDGPGDPRIDLRDGRPGTFVVDYVGQ